MLEKETLDFLAANKDSMLALAAIGALLMTGVTATLSLFGAIAAKKIDEKIKRQESIRSLNQDLLMGMGESIHGLLSAADILITKYEKKDENNDPSLKESIEKYKSTIGQHKETLRKAKTEYRYKLYGFVEGLTTISRCGDWTLGLKGDIPFARKLLKEAQKISLIVDKEIINCYRKGDFPSLFIRLRLKYHSWKIKRMWNNRQKSNKSI
ncbi:hypothetical protein AB4381_08265 [Vibrio splendidus]